MQIGELGPARDHWAFMLESLLHHLKRGGVHNRNSPEASMMARHILEQTVRLAAALLR